MEPRELAEAYARQARRPWVRMAVMGGWKTEGGPALASATQG